MSVASVPRLASVQAHLLLSCHRTTYPGQHRLLLQHQLCRRGRCLLRSAQQLPLCPCQTRAFSQWQGKIRAFSTWQGRIKDFHRWQGKLRAFSQWEGNIRAFSKLQGTLNRGSHLQEPRRPAMTAFCPKQSSLQPFRAPASTPAMPAAALAAQRSAPHSCPFPRRQDSVANSSASQHSQ